MFKVIFILSLIVAVFGVGCAKTSSDNIKTSGFFAHYMVEVSSTNPSNAVCTASYTVEDGSTTYIDLSSNDTVTCNGQTMGRSALGSIVTYSTNLTATVGGSYEIVLTRSGESPYSSTVTLTEAVTGTSPADNSSGSKGAVYSFSWQASANASDMMYVTTSKATSGDTNCPNTASFEDTAPENGSGSFSSTAMALPASGTAGACAMNLKWSRYRTGTMASGLNGRIRSLQTHMINFTLN